MLGYIEMPRGATRLTDCISLSGYSKKYPRAEITASIAFDLMEGTKVDPLGSVSPNKSLERTRER